MVLVRDLSAGPNHAMLIWCFSPSLLNTLCNFSPEMIKDVGCQWVIVGHPERRGVHNESDQVTITFYVFFNIRV